MKIDEILNKKELCRNDIIFLLKADKENSKKIFKKSEEVKNLHVGRIVYYRGLVEFSNKCTKNCYYCGIRAANKESNRFEIDDDLIINAVKFAYDNKYGSIVMQAGEREDSKFIDKVNRLLIKAKKITNNKIGITISLGEQNENVYKKWYENGAHRYLLRIESSNKELYEKIHPKNSHHNFDRRINCLKLLKKIGYQTGTGIMVGLPFQNYEHLADDLLFFKNFDIDMVGMGPYIEHEQTPLFKYKESLLPLSERFDLTIKMIAILRIMMKNINIAAATALQAIDPVGREKAIKIGANIIMPNITPTNRSDYQLYENKPCIDEGADDCTNCLEVRVNMTGNKIGYGEWGDSKHYAIL